ncbi:hypothetical protein DL89DRAFT_270898 [Linderina pennispora]|uniref:P-loop containing nucleoside triphosphate hydrolase protein n=1 Tax=Linderina pennispora TaxID=61395 RepID=A0A1Y1VWE4_9FUNG|nr:uncharacterized protein DL89DRAFT_270898 [Linderina pennispora]ORX65533.1 hypothetical protein DL89DRAFT_270898 [Linderina pennispora]
MERLGACSIGSLWPWQWDLERNACARRLIFEGAIPTMFLAICWWIGDFGRPGTLTSSARPLLKAGVRVPDNRVWVGPAVVLLMIVQTAVQTARATEPASLVLATEWLIVSLLAIMQAARYTKSDRFAFRGLFSGMLFGFVLVQLACSALEEYFSFFVRSQWHTPMWGEDMSSVAAAVHVKMLVNCVLLLLLLVVHPLPQCDYVADRVSQLQVGCRLQPKRLTAVPGAKLEPYELSQPLLSVLLFNWVSPILSDCRREHQVSRSDLRVPPDNCQVSSAYARFSMGAKPGQPLVRQLFSVFKVDLAIQIVYTFYNTFSDYIQPYLMQRVLRFIDEYLEDSSLGLRFGYFLAAMMLAASVVGTVVEQQQQWQSRGISMEIRNKTLRRRAHESKSKDDSRRDSSDGRMFGSLIIGCFYMYQLLVGVMAVGQRLIAQIGQTISEVIHGIISFIQVVGIKRARSKVWSLLNLWTVGMMPVIIFVVLFVYSFNAIAVFRVLQRAIFWMPGGVSHAISIYYLHEDDVQPAGERVEAAGHDLVWKRADDSAAAEEGTPLLLHGRQPEDSQAFALRNLTVRFPQGGLTIIGGPTALVGDMTVVSANGVMSDIAYVSQEPWLRNATIHRYEEPDLRTFVAGDQSEKQRVALARAIYSSRRILLIDDCLSAHILHTCLLSQSPLMRGRTRILVTHHMAMCLPHCHGEIEVSGCADGESQGEQAPADPMPEDEYNDERKVAADTPAAAGSQTGMQEAPPTGQLIKEEASVWAGYFVASGGWMHVVFCAVLIVADYYLALRSFHLSSSVLRMAAMLLTYHGGLRASTILHERLTNAVVYATPHFMTTTPIGRTLARFAKDFQVIDESIALSITLVIISAAVPLFAVVGIAVLGAYTSFTLDFMLSQRELKRLESTVFAPVLSLYSELIQGIDTIRGFGMQEAYMGEFTERFTEYVASDLTFRRMGLTSSLVGATTTVFILWKVEYFTSGLAGFIMIIAVNFWLESMGVMGFNSVEREAPAKSSVGNKPCPDLVVGFSIHAGEKIGISTLSLSLLRLVEATSGQVLIDGDLRQSITIVPQDPVLFNGTIRFNLDPFGEYPDEILLDALKRTLLLKSTHGSARDRSVAVFDSLDDEIRQLVALARTLTRRSKVILMDEATASNSTILCIAHRLRTIIDYDRVLVLENGRVEEFGTPAELIQAESGAFRTLCEKSGDMESLTKMIK